VASGPGLLLVRLGRGRIVVLMIIGTTIRSVTVTGCHGKQTRRRRRRSFKIFFREPVSMLCDDQSAGVFPGEHYDVSAIFAKQVLFQLS
jgi:hypothetical protein